MKQSIINEALKKIQQRKRKVENEFETKMQCLYDDSEFQELYKSLTKEIIKNSKLESMGNTVDRNEEKAIQNKIENLKRKFNVENLKIEYSCETCKDEGYFHGQMCNCLKKEISKTLLADSGFEKLEKFSDSINSSGDLKPVYLKMKEWCDSSFSKNLIYLAGPTGVGKTHLLRCMADQLIENGKLIKIVTAFQMNQDFKQFSRSSTPEFLNKYIDCEVLFIDDLGTEPLYKNITLEFLYLIINERKMKKLATVITSNLGLYEILNRYEERIFSRIADRKTSITLLLDGIDKRVNLK